jgi:hypothetical protein
MMRKLRFNRARVNGIARGFVAAVLLGAPFAVAAPAHEAAARTVLFIGNSFTAGMHSPVWHFHAAKVEDLNHTGVYGVPALFELFTIESGLDYRVSIETVPGANLRYIFDHERTRVDRAWDAVVMQEYSALDPKQPGNPALFETYALRFGRLFAARRRDVQVWLMAPWSRPDMTYRIKSPWYGESIEAMATDLQSIYSRVAHSSPQIKGVVPVGTAFNLAIADGFASADPYKCIGPGKMNLWAYDNHHASEYGYYLEALTDFGRITGRDPRALGGKERAAVELGISPEEATELQRAAWQALQARQ